MTTFALGAVLAPVLRRTRRPALALAPRWLVLALAAGIAFHQTATSVASDIAVGSGLTYVVVVPLYAVFAAAAVRRRNRASLSIHDRETDIIVGGIAVVLALAATALLGPQLSGVYYLWRIDLLMLCVFVFGGSTLLFGLRRTLYYRLAWLVLLLWWPLPMRLITFTVGQGSVEASAIVQLSVVVAVIVIGHRPGDPYRWWPAVIAAVLGAGLVLLLDLDAHPWRQLVAAVAAVAVGTTFWLTGRRRPVAEPVVQRPVVAAVVLLICASIGAFVVPAPPVASVPSRPVVPTSARPVSIVPAGWAVTSTVDYTGGPSRYFGVHAEWQRYVLQARDVAVAGPGSIDGQGRAREIVVDVLTTRRPRTLVLYPVVTTYPMGTLELTPAADVDLGAGVSAQLYAAVDNQRQLTWTMLSFTWVVPTATAVEQPRADDPAELTQRITVMTVDDHRLGAPFPEPSSALLDSVRAAVASILRGSRTTTSSAGPKDVDLLLHVGRDIVSRRVGGS